MNEEIESVDPDAAYEQLHTIAFKWCGDEEFGKRMGEAGHKADDPLVRLYTMYRLVYGGGAFEWRIERVGMTQEIRTELESILSKVDPAVFDEVEESHPEYAAFIQKCREYHKKLKDLADNDKSR